MYQIFYCRQQAVAEVVIQLQSDWSRELTTERKATLCDNLLHPDISDLHSLDITRVTITS